MNLYFRRTLIIILIFLCSIAGIEVLFKAGSFVVNNLKSFKKAQVKQQTTVVEQNAKKYPIITETGYEIKIYEFFRIIKEKNFEKAYALLDESFKPKSFPTLHTFEAYCKKNYLHEKGKNYVSTNFRKEADNIYSADVIFSVIDAPLTTPKYREKVVLKFLNEKDYRISFNNFVTEVKMDEKVEIEGITIKVKKVERYLRDFKVIVEITNTNVFPVNIAQKPEDIWVGGQNVRKKPLKRIMYLSDKELNSSNFILKPGEGAAFKIPFYLDAAEKPKVIFFSNIKAGEKVLQTQVFLKGLE